jgi:hypothetical protein
MDDRCITASAKTEAVVSVCAGPAAARKRQDLARGDGLAPAELRID